MSDLCVCVCPICVCVVRVTRPAAVPARKSGRFGGGRQTSPRGAVVLPRASARAHANLFPDDSFSLLAVRIRRPSIPVKSRPKGLYDSHGGGGDGGGGGTRRPMNRFRSTDNNTKDYVSNTLARDTTTV